MFLEYALSFWKEDCYRFYDNIYRNAGRNLLILKRILIRLLENVMVGTGTLH